jgi:hypothetical protein
MHPRMIYAEDGSPAFADIAVSPAPAEPPGNYLQANDHKSLIPHDTSQHPSLQPRTEPKSSPLHPHGHPAPLPPASRAFGTANSPNRLQNTLEQTDSKHPIENRLRYWFRPSKKEFRAPNAQECTKTHKSAQSESARLSVSPCRRVSASPPPARPYRRNTLPSGSSSTFTGVPGTGTLNVTAPSAVRTQCVNVFPCPN